MKRHGLVTPALLLALLLLAFGSSCNSGSRNDETDAGFVPVNRPGQSGGTLSLPILFGLDGSDTLCVGRVITLRGVNFSADLVNNKVSFRFGTKTIDGVPLSVAFPLDNSPSNGLDSILRVLVPTGLATGSVELEVNGFFAGAIGFIACPMIYGFEVGVSRDQAALVHGGPLGFNPQIGPETVWIHGLNFDEVTDVIVEDGGGRRFIASPQIFRRRRINPTNGMDSIELSLQNAKVTVRAPRDNLTIWVVAGDFESNRVSVPVQPFESATGPVGPVIKAVTLPTGVRSGAVRIFYSFYDRPINAAYNARFQWTADNGENWFPAIAKLDDPFSSGTQPNLPGVVLPGSLLSFEAGNLLRGGGGLRAFTWDAQNDQNFRDINETVNSRGESPARNWVISFRVEAQSTGGQGGRPNPGILFQTPPIAYFDLEDRPGDSQAANREGVFVEDFSDAFNRDTPLTDALWGPPFNQGSLEGRLAPRATSQFGSGTHDLVMELTDDSAVLEFYRIDTDLMSISRVLVFEEDDGVVESSQIIFPTVQLENPGAELGEFHLRTWTIDTDIEVRTQGSRPLIVRLSGGDSPGDNVAFTNLGVIDANGNPGGAFDPGRPQDPPRGGRGVLGSGKGGDGALLEIDPMTGDILELTVAEPGGLNGGGAGETPAAMTPTVGDPTRFHGAPGGGGGARLAGNAGDPGNVTPDSFPKPRGGFRGPKRGSPELIPLVPGSGGGGGGSSILGVSPELSTAQGTGGGSGGGAVFVTVRGSILFGASASIQANGGNGGDLPGASPTMKSGGGGGGSGGAILLRATGFVNVGCGSLLANGGLPGMTGTGNNPDRGDGEGGPGWARVESGFGGSPFCTFLPIEESVLSEDIRKTNSRNQEIPLENAADFPTSGFVVIDEEEIFYGSRTNTRLQEISRGLNGEEFFEAHSAGARVTLQAILEPGESYVGRNVQESPDAVIPTLLGLDQVLHCSFIPSRDPQTNDVLRDAAGNVQSVWIFNTDRGEVFDPRGFLVKRGLAFQTQPGLLQLTRLIIDQGVTLRGIGSNPMDIRVSGAATINGTLNVSGFPGGTLRFDRADPTQPLPGLGGSGGPGGGDGGNGAGFEFRDGDPTNKVPENIDIVPAQVGGLPPELPEHFDVTPIDFAEVPNQNELGSSEVVRATPGDSLRDASCETVPPAEETCDPTRGCTDTAGGGGGGGHLRGGSPGESIPEGLNGFGGSRLGTDSFRIDGLLMLIGGGGGGGGGGSAAVSECYAAGETGEAIFQADAAFAPGTGGGGGGGILRIAVREALSIGGTAKILANGGDAFQSIDLGGNAGAGAGGSIFIQVENALNIENGARIEARGGRANLSVPTASGERQPPHEGNIRLVAGEEEEEDVLMAYGGKGGDGASGRVRIEAPRNSILLGNTPSISNSISAGVISTFAEESVAFSLPVRFGVGPGRAVYPHDIEVTSTTVDFGRFGIPQGTDAILLWQGASESADEHGEVGEFSLGVQDINDLVTRAFLRFEARFVSDNITREVPAIQRLQVNYRMK